MNYKLLRMNIILVENEKKFEHNSESRNWYNVFGNNIWESVSRHQSRYHCPHPGQSEHASPQWFDRK